MIRDYIRVFSSEVHLLDFFLSTLILYRMVLRELGPALVLIMVDQVGSRLLAHHHPYANIRVCGL